MTPEYPKHLAIPPGLLQVVPHDSLASLIASEKIFPAVPRNNLNTIYATADFAKIRTDFANLGPLSLARASKPARRAAVRSARQNRASLRQKLHLSDADYAALKILTYRARFVRYIDSAQELAKQIGEQDARSLAAPASLKRKPVQYDSIEALIEKLGRVPKEVPYLRRALRRHASISAAVADEQWQTVDKVAVDLIVQMNTIFPERRRLVLTFLNASNQDLRMVKDRLSERYDSPVSLAKVIRTMCTGFAKLRFLSSPEHRAAFRSAIQNDRPAAIAHLIAAEMPKKNTKRPSFLALAEILDQHQTAEILKVVKIFDEHYTSRFGKLQQLPDRFKQNEAEFLQSVLCPRPDTTQPGLEYFLQKARYTLRPTWKERSGLLIFHTLAAHAFFSELSSEQLQLLRDNFETRFKRTMSPYASDDVFARAAPTALHALLVGDLESERAAKMKLGLNHSEIVRFCKDLMNLSAEKRREWAETFKSEYRIEFLDYAKQRLALNFLKLRFHSRRGDFFVLRNIMNDGKVSDEARIFAAVDGLGTNEKAVKSILKGKSRDEIIALAERYGELTQKILGRRDDLFRRLRRESSGSAWFDIRQSLQGKEKDFKKRLFLIKETIEFEQARFKVERVDVFSLPTRRMSLEGGAMQKQYDKMVAKVRSAAFERLSEIEKERVFSVLERQTRRSIQSFRLVKNVWAERVAAAVTPILTTTSLILLEVYFRTIVDQYVLVGASISVGAVVFIGVKWLCKGKSYGFADGIGDGLRAVFSISVRSFSKRLSAEVLRYTLNGSKFGVVNGVKWGLRKISSGGDPRRNSEDNLTLREMDSVLAEDEISSQLAVAGSVVVTDTQGETETFLSFQNHANTTTDPPPPLLIPIDLKRREL